MTTATSAARDTRTAILDSAQRIMSHRGYAAVGLNEVLSDAGVPKGSFYHFFSSKDAFGEALMRRYFVDYLAEMDALLARPDLTAPEKLLAYFESWRVNQSVEDCQGKCLAVKLGAEVADLSEAMRSALRDGVAAIVDRLEAVVDDGCRNAGLRPSTPSRQLAEILYDLWLGASVVAKINRDRNPLDTAMNATRTLLNL